ncbi:phosphopantetheine-binding protein [Photobacterium marinum]|uniref:Phosphopantetheine-binding protein n=1 Tax=Photobacterium marinum TaxID=1056511 RepID=L8JHA4_9GAMM|nr:acyl carrier protein [Photobacterium marinum]ELR66904.1 phosphopantetheine-binding protein [Photobacterium marinum]
MNIDEIRMIIMTAIQGIAPEIEEGDIDPDEDLRDECDLDSMDFLNLLTAIKKACGVNIPEQDYPKVRTLSCMIKYLHSHLVQ